jgi:hypothetical protein
MAPHTTSQNSDSRLLRRTLQGNGIFCGLSGAAFMVGAWPLTTFLGLSTPIILLILGLVLLLTALSLFRAAAPHSIDYRTGLLYAIIDSMWVVGSVILLLTSWIPFTTEGEWAVGVVAIIVALFASLEFYGSSRAR